MVFLFYDFPIVMIFLKFLLRKQNCEEVHFKGKHVMGESVLVYVVDFHINVGLLSTCYIPDTVSGFLLATEKELVLQQGLRRILAGSES